MRMFDLPIRNNPLRTREDVQLAFRQLCKPLEPYYSEGKARLYVGNTGASYADGIAELEGFSRVLWGLAPMLAGGGASELIDTYVAGIRSGTDPGHEEYWGEAADYDQRLVEMAAFGLALAIAPDRIWEPLSEQERENLVRWLNQMNRKKLYDCNWLLFLVLVNLGLKQVGVPYDQEQMEQNLRRIDDFYLQDGWYADGIGGHCDYYGPFAIHYYCLVYAKLMGAEDPERAKLYKDRAAEFAGQFIYWFAQDGSALPYGRSLTYRFAQSAFWSALAYAEAEPFPMGVLKGLLLRNMRWWFQQPMFNRDGTLSIGYAYPNLVMAENYNSPGSPYWAFKSFLPLALPAEHPFWEAEELPLPELHASQIQLPAHLVLHRHEAKDHVLAFNAGHPSTNEHTHTSAKYEKFVYSNAFGFSVPRAEWGIGQGALDSMLALSEAGENLFRVKRRSEVQRIEGDLIYMQWQPWNDVTVETWLATGTPWHVRVHRIDSKRPLDAAEGGFALGIEPLNGEASGLDVLKADDRVRALSPRGTSGIVSLFGNGHAELVAPNANTNVLHARTVIPTVRYHIEPGVVWLITAVYGEPGRSDTTAACWEQAPFAELINGVVSVYSKDGSRPIFQYEL